MPHAVRFDRYGVIDVLQVVQVERPVPGPGQVLVRVKAAGVNPGEAAIRQGAMAQRWPATFPSGQGSDLAGVVAEIGAGVESFVVGEEVIGFTNNRVSQAEFVVVEPALPPLRVTLLGVDVLAPRAVATASEPRNSTSRAESETVSLASPFPQESVG